MVLDDATAGETRVFHGGHVLGGNLQLGSKGCNKSTQTLAKTTMDLSVSEWGVEKKRENEREGRLHMVPEQRSSTVGYQSKSME